MAAVWLDGGTLYEDVIDTNPPFIVFLTAVPVCLARISGVPAPVVFKMFVLAAEGFEAPESMRADQLVIRDARLPYLKFPRNPTE